MADLNKVYAALEDFATAIRDEAWDDAAPEYYHFGDRETDTPTTSDVYHALREVIIWVELYNQAGLVKAYEDGFVEGKEKGYDEGYEQGYDWGRYDDDEAYDRSIGN